MSPSPERPARARAGANRLHRILDALEKRYGKAKPPPSRDPFELILWENVAYLVSDERRRAAFEALRKSVGLTPDAILAAAPEDLRAVAALGGMGGKDRPGRLQAIAALALSRFGGDLGPVLKRPFAEARKALKEFPSIGDPGAEKVLLFTGTAPVLALDSNGLRALLRIGYGEETRNYSKSYRSAQAAAAPEIEPDCRWLARAYALLRTHGQTLCRTNAPLCADCPVRPQCHYAQTTLGGSS